METRNVRRLLVEMLEGKLPLARTRRTWLDNIKMDLLGMGFGSVDWIGLAEDRYKWRALAKAVMRLGVP
jgi:predicted small integral membrane protein